MSVEPLTTFEVYPSGIIELVEEEEEEEEVELLLFFVDDDDDDEKNDPIKGT